MNLQKSSTVHRATNIFLGKVLYILLVVCLPLMVLLMWSWSNADQDTTSEVLEDFDHYGLTSVKSDDVQKIYDELRTDLTNNPNNNCYERAHAWAYQMKHDHDINSGKVYLFYSVRTWNFNGKGWWFHVAPYIASDGKEMVMEKFFGIQKPLTLEEWAYQQTGGKHCQVLTEADDELLKWIPKSYSMPATPSLCYIRKAPMYYRHPIGIYNHDVQNQKAFTNFIDGDVYSSCYYSIAAASKRERKAKCNAFMSTPSGNL